MKPKTKSAASPRRLKPPFARQRQRPPGLEGKMRPRPQYRAESYPVSGKLAGKTALVTGGDSGIGRAVAVLFAREGADVAIVYLKEERPDAEECRMMIEACGRRALLLPGDVGDSRFCSEAVKKVVSEFGSLDILVNNAAVQKSRSRIEDLSDEQWRRTFRTNLAGYFIMARAAVPVMKKGSAIVNCTSVTSMRGSKELLDYSATKGAIATFTKSLGANLLERGIRVNAVAPGPVWTPLNVIDSTPEESAHYGEDYPMGRPAQPEEIAPAFLFFASQADSSYITGEVLGVLGGEVV